MFHWLIHDEKCQNVFRFISPPTAQGLWCNTRHSNRQSISFPLLNSDFPKPYQIWSDNSYFHLHDVILPLQGQFTSSKKQMTQYLLLPLVLCIHLDRPGKSFSLTWERCKDTCLLINVTNQEGMRQHCSFPGFVTQVLVVIRRHVMLELLPFCQSLWYKRWASQRVRSTYCTHNIYIHTRDAPFLQLSLCNELRRYNVLLSS